MENTLSYGIDLDDLRRFSAGGWNFYPYGDSHIYNSFWTAQDDTLAAPSYVEWPTDNYPNSGLTTYQDATTTSLEEYLNARFLSYPYTEWQTPGWAARRSVRREYGWHHQWLCIVALHELAICIIQLQELHIDLNMMAWHRFGIAFAVDCPSRCCFR